MESLFGFPVVETEELKTPEAIVLVGWDTYIGIVSGCLVVHDNDDIVIYKKKDNANS